MADEPKAHPLDLARLLAIAENTPPVDSIVVVAGELRRSIGGRHVSLLITNFSGTGLVRLSHVRDAAEAEDGENERAEPVDLAGSIYESTMFSQTPNAVSTADGWVVLAPITERGDAIGLLEVSLAVEPDRATVDHVAVVAHALAYLLIASRRHTDVYEWAQRDVAFSLAAEVQRRLLPSAYTVEGGHFALAGWLEPAHRVGGDTFDYSVDREYLYASMTDAMGHGVAAALLATLVVGSLRNSRRGAATPAGQADAANEAMLQNAAIDQFVTGQLLRIRLADGNVDFVNAGHPSPYLIRDGRATEVALADPQPPFGIAADAYKTQTAQLRPGDRLVLVTDGYLERNAIRLDLSELLTTSVGRHPREVVRELAGEVLAATEGNLLDDATILCIDWYGDPERRDATNGADADRATEPDAATEG
jgi:serine phosphatase RsbU (regulator of sigma subunit)